MALGAGRGREQHVFGLDVAVHDPGAVQAPQALGDLAEQAQLVRELLRPRRARRARREERGLERPSLLPIHDEAQQVRQRAAGRRRRRGLGPLGPGRAAALARRGPRGRRPARDAEELHHVVVGAVVRGAHERGGLGEHGADVAADGAVQHDGDGHLDGHAPPLPARREDDAEAADERRRRVRREVRPRDVAARQRGRVRRDARHPQLSSRQQTNKSRRVNP